uniref:Nudix hydrolase domain-containing protein n=1 Tax=Rhabditophanes sp. KR3021 TaxID=114890 RepID=A0AC35TVL3_9BILA
MLISVRCFIKKGVYRNLSTDMLTDQRKADFLVRLAKNAERRKLVKSKSILARFPDGTDRPLKGDSSVLAAIMNIDDKAHLLYTKRSMRLKNHKGEICFPGGKLDENEDWEMAALREADEEINLKASQLTVWSTMAPIMNRKMTHNITPILALIDKHVNLKNMTEEVDVIFAIPIDEISQNHHYTAFKFQFSFLLPYFESRNFKIIHTANDTYTKPDVVRIWGLTGLLTHQVLINLCPELYKPNIYLP